jgi:plasmid stability protein
MAQILVRHLAKAVVERLRRRARLNGRSLECEVRGILEQAAQMDPAAARKLADRIRRSFRGRKFSDSAALIREDRNR